MSHNLFVALVLATIFISSLCLILIRGYPGDGAKGYPTMYGRMERAAPQIARRRDDNL